MKFKKVNIIFRKLRKATAFLNGLKRKMERIKKMIISKINKVAFLQLKKKIELFSPEFCIGTTSNLKVYEVFKNAKKVARFDYKNESILICDNCVACGRDRECWNVFVD